MEPKISTLIVYEFEFYSSDDRIRYQVVDGTSSKLSHKLEFGAVLNVCRKLFCSLSNLWISFIQRQANNIAHFLARATLSYASHYLFDHVPTCVL